MDEPRITASELAGPGPSKERLISEVHRLRRLIVEGKESVAYIDDSTDGFEGWEALRAEAEAIRSESS